MANSTFYKLQWANNMVGEPKYEVRTKKFSRSECKEVFEWLNENVGIRSTLDCPRRTWRLRDNLVKSMKFQFHEANDAMKFKLTWGGK